METSIAKPIITIITPVYKKREYINQTIESVSAQTYPHIQYIIVDDGPSSVVATEISKRVSATRQGPPIELLLIHNDKNIGTVKTLNRAIEKAVGKYIFNIADDDCFYDKYVISDWVTVFETSDAQIITAKRAVYDETLQNLISIEPNDDEIKVLTNSTPDELFEVMAGKNIVFGCATAKTKKLFKEIGGYDEHYRCIEDYSSNMQLLRKGYGIQFWDRIVVKYRYGGISSGTKISKSYLKESDLLFKRDILPYVKNRKLARKEYNSWREEVICLSMLSEYAINNAKGRNYKVIGIIKFMITHPIMAFKKILRKIASVFNRCR